jgi:hypothetical protein
VDGTLLSLAETRQLLEREDDQIENSRQSRHNSDHTTTHPPNRIPTP